MRSLLLASAMLVFGSVLAGCNGGYRVEGEVLDETGAPVSGAEVSVLENGKAHKATTDANGHFQLHGASGVSEESSLEIRAPGHDPRTYHVNQACYRSFGRGDLGEPCPSTALSLNAPSGA